MPARPSKSLRLLLVDDHEILRDSLRLLMNAQPDLTVVGEAGDGLAAVRKARLLQPDVVLMDITMPKLDGVEATRRIRRHCPAIRILALTAHASPALLNDLRQAGAAGYVCKHSDGKRLLCAIRRVARGGIYFEKGLMGQASRQLVANPINGSRHRATPLSEREAQVLRLLAAGLTAKEAAAELQVATTTVVTYKARLLTKLGLSSRAELLRYARAHGLVEPG